MASGILRNGADWWRFGNADGSWRNPIATKLPIHAFASAPHFIDHIAPIFNAVGGESFYVPEFLLDYAKARVTCGTVKSVTIRAKIIHPHLPFELPVEANPIIVAAVGDGWMAAQTLRPILLLEHGCGLSYQGNADDHSGGGGPRRFTNVFLMTNEYCASRDRATYPNAAVYVIGCPRLDKWATVKRQVNRDAPTVCITAHWNAPQAPESKSAFNYFKDALPRLRDRWKLIGHCHVRALQWFQSECDALGIEVIPSQDTVFEQADLVIGDTGSMVYEFAALDLPVVVLNAPTYRREIRQGAGLRFWDDIPGIQCNEPDKLERAVERALADEPEIALMRRDAIGRVYPYLGCATQRAVEAIEDWRSQNDGLKGMPRLDVLSVKKSKPKSKLAVASGCSNVPEMIAASEDTFVAYAKRCKADYVRLDNRYPDGDATKDHEHWIKFHLVDLLEEYERVLWLDADTLVAPHCPNVFDIVPEGQLGAWCNEHKYFGHNGERRVCYDHGYFNSGVMVLDRSHIPMLRYGLQICKQPRQLMTPTECRLGFADQTPLNKAVQELQLPVFPLGDEWNFYCNETVCEMFGIKVTLETANIIHFAGGAHTPQELLAEWLVLKLGNQYDRKLRAKAMTAVRERLGW